MSTTKERYDGLVLSLGKATLNALYPNDFEYYMCALELVDSMDNSIEYLVFPIMPSAISKSEPGGANIKKSLGGVSIVSTNAFIPQDLAIKGNFGRRFKILFTQRGNSNNKITAKGIQGLKQSVQQFDAKIKTGFGTTKVLQRMLNDSNKVDVLNKPYRMYFYNLALSESYWVKKISATFSQTREQNNMMWEYNIVFKIIAPLNTLKGIHRRKNKMDLGIDLVQKGMNIIGGKLAGDFKIKGFKNFSLNGLREDLFGKK